MTRPDAPLAELTLRPRRSLSRAGFVALMAALIGFNFVAGVAFLAAGAWPVLGFLGLDVLLVWGAFRLSYGSARRSERLALWPDRLEIARRDAWGGERTVALQPYWLSVELERGPAGVERLLLRSHGRATQLGGFLPADERAALAFWLSAALAALREGRAVPPVALATAASQPSPSTSFIE
jgi:uncharacterized membrane protein